MRNITLKKLRKLFEKFTDDTVLPENDTILP